MKSKIILFALLAASSLALIAAKDLDQKQTLIIAYVKSSADVWDAEMDHAAAKQLQKILQNLNRDSSNKVHFDALIFPLTRPKNSEAFYETLFSSRYEKKFKEAQEVIFISLDHSNSNYNDLGKVLARYPHLKVPVVYNAGCSDLADAKYWHQVGKTALYVGHVGTSFSPAVYNAILEPMLSEYAQNGEITESELTEIVGEANLNFTQETAIASSLIDPIVGESGQQKNVSIRQYDSISKRISTHAEEAISSIQFFQSQSRAYVTTPSGFPK